MLFERGAASFLRKAGWRTRLAVMVLAASWGGQYLPVQADETADTLEARRKRIEQMSADEKDRLARRREQFASFSHQEQSRLRALHEHVDGDPKRDELRKVMHNYHEWLKTLSPGQRAEIARMSPDERLARIRQDHERRRQWVERRLSTEDLDALANWLERYLLSELPRPHRERLAQRLEGLEGPGRRMMLSSSLRYSRGRMPSLSPESFEQLADRLSPGPARKLRETLLDTNRRRRQRLLSFWIGQLNEQANRQLQKRFRQVDDEELAQVFERLPDWERDHLLDLPPDQIQRELRLRYFRSKLGGQRGPRTRRPGNPAALPDSRRRLPPASGRRRGPSRERPPLRPS